MIGRYKPRQCFLQPMITTVNIIPSTTITAMTIAAIAPPPSPLSANTVDVCVTWSGADVELAALVTLVVLLEVVVSDLLTRLHPPSSLK